MKTTGAEWDRFCKDMPDCFYFDDTELPEEFSDTDQLDVDCGVVMYHGGHDIRALPGVISVAELSQMQKDERDGISLTTVFKRWRKSQTTDTLTVQVPKDKRDLIMKVIRTNGGTVL